MITEWCRSLLRLLLLVATLNECLVRFYFLTLRLGRQITVHDRARWLHESCLRVLYRMSFRRSFRGPLPPSGLVVSNHLSHLDILVYGATLPCIFVAKSELRRWPLFGLLARLGGTIFIERGNVISTASAASRMENLLRENIPVLLFPEGTSSDGSTVLRFHAALFHSAVRAQQPIAPAAIRYSAGQGVPEKDLCYYGPVRFLPHLLKTLGRRDVQAALTFGSDSEIYSSRKAAANETWQQVMLLRGHTVSNPGDAAATVSPAANTSR